MLTYVAGILTGLFLRWLTLHKVCARCGTVSARHERVHVCRCGEPHAERGTL